MDSSTEYIYAIIAKSLTDQLTESETAELKSWKSSSRRNHQEYIDFVSIWEQSGTLKMESGVNENKAFNAVLQRKGNIRAKKRWINWAVQAAAVLLFSVIFSGLYGYFTRNNQQLNFANNSSLPVYQEVKAAFGTQAKVELADGTFVFLNSGSKLRFPQSFVNQEQRKVFLNGEGYFVVTKNKKQPFIVQTNQLDIKVLGTTFNVDAYSDNSILNIALIEGSVEIQQNIENQVKDLMKLAPNQVASLNLLSKTLVKSDVEDLYKYTAWISGRIVFFNDPIQTVVYKLAKWYNVEINISDKRLENYKFTGTFIDEPLEQILDILSMTSPMTYNIEPIHKQADNSMSKRKIILKSKS